MPLQRKSYALALKITKLCLHIIDDRKEYLLTKQCIRSSTSIGANISEAQQSESRKDFISKFSISLKEGYETRYWICLLRDTNYLNPAIATELLNELDEVLAMLGSSICTAKRNLKKVKQHNNKTVNQYSSATMQKFESL